MTKQKAVQMSELPTYMLTEEEPQEENLVLGFPLDILWRDKSPSKKGGLMSQRGMRKCSSRIMTAGLLGFACGVVSILAIIESGPKAIAMRHMIPYTDWHTGKAVAHAVPNKSVKFPAVLSRKPNKHHKGSGAEVPDTLQVAPGDSDAWRSCKEAPDLQCHAHHGRMYAFSTKKETWDNAEARCRELGGDSHLVSIHGTSESQYVASKVKAEEDFWIGLRFDGSEWLWAKGKQLTFEQWPVDTGRPQSVEDLTGSKGPRHCTSSNHRTIKAHHHETEQLREWKNDYCSEHEKLFVCRWTV